MSRSLSNSAATWQAKRASTSAASWTRKSRAARPSWLSTGGFIITSPHRVTFGQILRKNYPTVVGTSVVDESMSAATVVGPLCTPLDLLADTMPLGHAEVGRSDRCVPVRRIWTLCQSDPFPESSGAGRVACLIPPPRPSPDIESTADIWQQYPDTFDRNHMSERLSPSGAHSDASWNGEEPLVSVIVPAYNAESHIARALQSISGQTYPKRRNYRRRRWLNRCDEEGRSPLRLLTPGTSA